MPIFKTYSYLVADSVEKFPIPQNVLDAFPNIKWDEFEWDVVGLPENGNYSLVSGKILYKDSDESGEVKIQKSEFTGEAKFQGVTFNTDPKGINFILLFKCLFFKGELMEVELLECKEVVIDNYDEKLQATVQAVSKTIKRNNSWWYRWLYKPYFYLIRSIAYVIIHFLIFIQKAITLLTYWITPL